MSEQLMTPAEIERATVVRCAIECVEIANDENITPSAEACAYDCAAAILALTPMFGDVPAGWKFVPLEPTGEMLGVLTNVAARCNSWREGYKAMLADAPTAGQAAAKDAEPVEKEADGWIKWEGGDCPVPEGTLVDVRYRDGQEQFNLPADEINPGKRDASYAFWINDAQDNDIIAYRVLAATPEVK